MNSTRAIILGASILALTGCAGGMLPGKIYATDGRALDFEIEKAHRTGIVRATDRSTGENFTGTYVGLLERVDVHTSSTTVRGGALASGFGSGTISSNLANASAVLRGDKGTVLNCQMKIEAGFSPHGMGDCQDNHGRKYTLQF